MGKQSAVRLFGRTLLQPFSQSRAPLRCAADGVRSFSSSRSRRAEPRDGTSAIADALAGFSSGQTTAPKAAPPQSSTMGELADTLGRGQATFLQQAMSKVRNTPIDTSVLDGMKDSVDDAMGEYHFNIYAHKHNTHFTVSKPNRDVIISVSCGNLGFKKSKRGEYDAAFQLGSYVMERLQQKGWQKKMQNIEVQLRGFGPGREAVTKILLGNEGRMFRSAIRRVSDGTKLKFGGTRSKKPRRLG